MTSKKIVDKASFDKAYKFYCSKNDKAAIGVLRKLDQNEPRVMELKAQIAYRMENFDEAMNLLKKLLRTHSDEFDEIRRSNFIAVQARLHSQGSTQEVDLISLDTFNLMFNASCHLIVSGKFNEAYELLCKALEECKCSLAKDGLDELAIKREEAPIRTQIAYVLKEMGNDKEALKIYQQINKPNIRRKRRRLPANYDPSVQPDPERWLPRQERTAYRKKLHKKFKDREVGKGTQGVAATTSANIDYSAKSTTTTGAAPPPTQAPQKPAEGPRQQRPNQAKKIKKKKGGKW
uniref:Signal recognition particle subunit SRP72 n=1 Tax=Meloidogyne hapla TaxID=6305 RepID=A0A1I8BI41_MELHA